MKFPRPPYENNSERKIPKQEQGLSILIALMMGMVLMAGVTGLLLRQLMARKLGASESYQQMAETAALNGFNRILNELNDNNSSSYKGYLFTLNHHGGDINTSGGEQWGWNASEQSPLPLRELCTNRAPLPDAVPEDSSTGEPPHVALTEGTTSQRDDGKKPIQLHYRLRGYTSTATASNNGTGEGRFQIEGLVVRDGDDPGKGYLARTLLLRSLYVNSIVPGEGDWAVLAGQTLSLGNTNIESIGKVLLFVNNGDGYFKFDPDPDGEGESGEFIKGCSPNELLEDVGGTDSTTNDLKYRIVPILENGLPSITLWNRGLTKDKAENSDQVRIWSFDDTGALNNCNAIACSRDADTADAIERSDLEESDGSVIRLSESELCRGTGDVCHIYVEHINLASTRLLIETSDEKPVVLHLEYPGTSTVAPSEPGITGSINLGSGAQLCGVNAGEEECNEKPEQLIIVSAAPKPDGVRSCVASPGVDQYVLAFDGDSLPAASVHLIPGIVKIGPTSTELKGLIWADAICNDADSFNLITATSESSNVVRDLNQQWNWEEQKFPGFGQMVTRGIRGTGLDTFRRW